MLSQHDVSSPEVKSDANEKFDVRSVYGIVKKSAFSKIPENFDFAEALHKSTKTPEEYTKNAGYFDEFTVKNSKKTGLTLAELESFCEFEQKRYLKKYQKLSSINSFFTKAIFFSRIDLIQPATQKILSFNDFAELSEHIKKHPRPFDVTVKSTIKQLQPQSNSETNSQNLFNNGNSFWYKPVVVTACVGALATAAYMCVKNK